MVAVGWISHQLLPRITHTHTHTHTHARMHAQLHHCTQHALAIVEVAKSNDLSRTFFARSHLGRILKPGDHALGYDLTNVNFNNACWETFKARNKSGIPDVILIKKSYPNARKKMKSRPWKMKGLVKEAEMEQVSRGKLEAARGVDDQELFMRELEEDPEMRGMVNLYVNPAASGADAGHVDMEDAMDGGEEEHDQDDDDDDDDEDEEPEEDFPTIQLDELLEDFDNLNIEGMEEV